MSADERDELHAALATLPPLPQQVVTLRILDGLSGNETAQLLNCSPAVVSRQLHLGLSLLRKIIGR